MHKVSVPVSDSRLRVAPESHYRERETPGRLAADQLSAAPIPHSSSGLRPTSHHASDRHLSSPHNPPSPHTNLQLDPGAPVNPYLTRTPMSSHAGYSMPPYRDQQETRVVTVEQPLPPAHQQQLMSRTIVQTPGDLAAVSGSATGWSDPSRGGVGPPTEGTGVSNYCWQPAPTQLVPAAGGGGDPGVALPSRALPAGLHDVPPAYYSAPEDLLALVWLSIRIIINRAAHHQPSVSLSVPQGGSGLHPPHGGSGGVRFGMAGPAVATAAAQLDPVPVQSRLHGPASGLHQQPSLSGTQMGAAASSAFPAQHYSHSGDERVRLTRDTSQVSKEQGPLGANLFTCRLPEWADEIDLYRLVASVGLKEDFQGCAVMRHDEGFSKNVGFLSFKTPNAAFRALNLLDGAQLSLDSQDERMTIPQVKKKAGGRLIVVDVKRTDLAEMLATLDPHSRVMLQQRVNRAGLDPGGTQGGRL
uniref:RRM domain-containing protein n=1 Tax=Chromera velia CCMP2878 TaxID=1169474 RepID=A0A0G4FVT7_9ALVE|eukprot:Cvel_3802.t1-p1 / transcript=Cvel_3802.t1 / gene=Cvel_3802 / organism=Chromera_velia_CCMP2878 / gene_product=hypothetical protein / transcript_product=hypothetical protein / location=Cvel_scaffold160:21937-27050(-) / protein_length=470 / sequence_SO=supercontig / SO=protein_coding / is_pseudo=false